jgi:sugar phosphate isomerase/epimerase
MKVGTMIEKLGSAYQKDPFAALKYIKTLGLDGLSFSSVLQMSPNLDQGKISELKAFADDLGLYLEAGIGKINPFNTAEETQVHALGNGDYRIGIEKMISAGRKINIVEYWGLTAGYHPDYSGYYANDRFRTDVDWPDQLNATQKFLGKLAPLLRDLGCRINIENHDDITTFEVIRIIETLGSDILGMTFDVGNCVLRCEDPVRAARRSAPYVHMTHVKDLILFFDAAGLIRQQRIIGEGIIDWNTLLPIIFNASPDIVLTIEDNRMFLAAQIFDPKWLAAQPDLTIFELSELVRLAKLCEWKIERGEILDPQAYAKIIFDEHEKATSLQKSADYLRTIGAELSLTQPG